MTHDEREQLNRFLLLLMQAQASPKDAEAAALIREACARQPDAEYLLVQRVMQLEHQLKAATAAAAGTSFVGDANAWGRAPVPMQAPTGEGAQVRMQDAPVRMAQPQPQPQPAAAPASAWGSGLLGTVAMTAGGVIAGSLLARGIGSLFGHHDTPADQAAIPPGGGTLVETDYGEPRQDGSDADGGYVADDFDPGDIG